MAIYKDHKQQELLVFYSISEAAQNQFFFFYLYVEDNTFVLLPNV